MLMKIFNKYLINDLQNIIYNYLTDDDFVIYELIPDLQNIVYSYIKYDIIKYNLYKRTPDTISEIIFHDSYYINIVNVNFDFTIFPNLKRLTIINSLSIEKKNIISQNKTPSIEYLNLPNNVCMNDHFLKCFTNLKELCLNNNRIITYKGLQYLKKIEYLHLIQHFNVINPFIKTDHIDHDIIYPIDIYYPSNVQFNKNTNKNIFYYLPELKNVYYYKPLLTKDSLYVYATNINIMRIMDGLGGLSYAN